MFFLSKVITSTTYTNSLLFPDPTRFTLFRQNLRAEREISWYDPDVLYEYIGKPSQKLNTLRVAGRVETSDDEVALENAFCSAERYWLFDGRGHKWKVRMSSLTCQGARNGGFDYTAEFFVYDRATCDSLQTS